MKRALDIALSLSTLFGSPFNNNDTATCIISHCDAQSKYTLHCTSHNLSKLSSYNNLSSILDHNPNALTEKEKNYALLWATQRSHHQIVEKLLECSTNPNADNRLHLSPLTIAQAKEDTQMIEVLEKHNGIINPKCKTLPHFVIAIYTRDTETLQPCINHDEYDPDYTFNIPCDTQHHGCKGYNNNILHLAAHIGDANILTILLAQPNISTKINQSSSTHHSYYTPYWIAYNYNYIAFMETLAAHPNMNINITSSQDCSPIGEAACRGHTNLVKLLTSHKSYEPDTIDAHNVTPLYLAAEHNHIGTAKIFLDDPRININYLYKKKFTPLYVASQNGHAHMVRLLLTHPNIKEDLTGQATPLYVACQNGHLDCVRILCLANPNMINMSFEGYLPLDVAANDEIKELVMKYGGKQGEDIQ